MPGASSTPNWKADLKLRVASCCVGCCKTTWTCARTASHTSRFLTATQWRIGPLSGHRRRLTSVFGEVVVDRLAYRRRGHHNLHPADAVLNLPPESHSHGLRRLAAIEATRGSFDAGVAALERATGQRVGKRQVEQLTSRAAVDFEDFSTWQPPAGACGDLLVLSCDGKGVVMRPEALRPATARAAATSTTKLATRLSKGENRNRKHLAEVGAVYDATPVPRVPADVLSAASAEPAHDTTREQTSRARTGPVAWSGVTAFGLVEQVGHHVGGVADQAGGNHLPVATGPPDSTVSCPQRPRRPGSPPNTTSSPRWSCAASRVGVGAQRSPTGLGRQARPGRLRPPRPGSPRTGRPPCPWRSWSPRRSRAPGTTQGSRP